MNQRDKLDLRRTKPDKLAVIRANSLRPTYSPWVLLSVMLDCGGCGLPRRFAPRNDMQKFAGCLRLPEGTAGVLPETSLHARLRLLHSTAPNALTTADTHLPSACHCKPRSCTRAHVLPSACHCEPVRTLVWQSVLPAGKPGNLAILWANSHPRSPVVIASQCAHWCGNPRPRRETWQVSNT